MMISRCALIRRTTGIHFAAHDSHCPHAVLEEDGDAKAFGKMDMDAGKALVGRGLGADQSERYPKEICILVVMRLYQSDHLTHNMPTVMSKLVSTIACTATFLLASCSSDLSRDVAELRGRTDALEAEVTAIKTDREIEKLFRDFDKIAFLTPGSDGYAVIKTDLGILTVTLKDIQPYANGSRVILTWGNPMSATINGLKAKIEWGKVNEEGSPQNDSAKSRDFTFSESLTSGSWTNVPVVLEAVPPAELGFIRIRDATHTGIRLLTR